MLSLHFSPVSQVSRESHQGARARVREHPGGGRAGEEPKPKGNRGTAGTGGTAEMATWKMNELGPNSSNFKHQPQISS